MIARTLAKELVNIAGKYPVISVTGPRQSGKTTLIKSLAFHTGGKLHNKDTSAIL